MKRFKLVMLAVTAAILLTSGSPVSVLAQDDDLTGNLVQVGEVYAIGYISPFVEGFGTDLNSALYSTASIPKTKITVSIGLKVAGASLNEADQAFTTYLQDVAFSDYLPPGHPNYNDTGDIRMEGPTVFGNTDDPGTITAIYHGIDVWEEETIAGIVETTWVPFAIPEVSVGGVMGLRGTIRWIPEVNVSDWGKIKFLGYGLQYSADDLLPTLPVSLMIGFFSQKLEVGTILETKTKSIFAAASKSFGTLTAYGGLHIEESKMKISYTEEATDLAVDFEVEGKQTSRLTLGAALNFGVKINAEVGLGKLTTFAAGIGFGF